MWRVYYQFENNITWNFLGRFATIEEAHACVDKERTEDRLRWVAERYQYHIEEEK